MLHEKVDKHGTRNRGRYQVVQNFTVTVTEGRLILSPPLPPPHPLGSTLAKKCPLLSGLRLFRMVEEKHEGSVQVTHNVRDGNYLF